jgi:hypothetical protein
MHLWSHCVLSVVQMVAARYPSSRFLPIATDVRHLCQTGSQHAWYHCPRSILVNESAGQMVEVRFDDIDIQEWEVAADALVLATISENEARTADARGAGPEYPPPASQAGKDVASGQDAVIQPPVARRKPSGGGSIANGTSLICPNLATFARDLETQVRVESWPLWLTTPGTEPL